MDEVDKILSERRTTHGAFADKAELGQWFKDKMRASPSWPKMTAVQRDALDHVLGDKVARILVGNPDEKDHWLDAMGYLRLGIREIDEKKEREKKSSAE